MQGVKRPVKEPANELFKALIGLSEEVDEAIKIQEEILNGNNRGHNSGNKGSNGKGNGLGVRHPGPQQAGPSDNGSERKRKKGSDVGAEISDSSDLHIRRNKRCKA